MTAEQEILVDLLATVRELVASSRETLALLPELPVDAEAFAAMPVLPRVASTAALKQFEQLEDALNGLFRTTLRMMGVRLKGLYPLDIGLRMEELRVVDDAPQWLAVVKLRNELLHEYSGDPADRLARLKAALAFMPFLFDAADRIEQTINHHGLLKGSAQ